MSLFWLMVQRVRIHNNRESTASVADMEACLESSSLEPQAPNRKGESEVLKVF